MGELQIVVVNLELLPIPLARVALAPGLDNASTDERGELTLRLVAGRYAINVSAPSFESNLTAVDLASNQKVRLIVMLEASEQLYYVPTYDAVVFQCGVAMRNSTLGRDGECQPFPHATRPSDALFQVPQNFSFGTFVFAWGEPGDGQRLLIKASLERPARSFPDGGKALEFEGTSPLHVELPADAVDATLRNRGHLRFTAFAPPLENSTLFGVDVSVEATFYESFIGRR
jgi:hypothetical protein